MQSGTLFPGENTLQEAVRDAQGEDVGGALFGCLDGGHTKIACHILWRPANVSQGVARQGLGTVCNMSTLHLYRSSGAPLTTWHN